MKFQEETIRQLRSAVEVQWGKRIAVQKDCIQLAQDFAEKGVAISAQTLRRFFGLVPYTGGFSTYTLNQLADYCGAKDFEDFKSRQLTTELQEFLRSDGKENSHELWLLSEKLCRNLIDNPALLVSLQHRLLQHPAARTFFLEHHPIRDLSCTVYTQYFQEYLLYKKSNEAKLYAYGFLFMGAFLSGNEEFMEIYHHKIVETPLTPEVYLLPAGRKYGVLLLYAWLRNDRETFDRIFLETQKLCDVYREASKKSVCSFEYAVLEHLIFTDRTEEMLFLIEHHTSQKYRDRDFVPQDRKENHVEVWKILCAMAYLKAGDEEKSQDYYKQVRLSKLAVGWQKYYTLLFYFVQYEFESGEARRQLYSQIEKLIHETHFTYYRGFLKKLKNRELVREL